MTPYLLYYFGLILLLMNGALWWGMERKYRQLQVMQDRTIRLYRRRRRM